MLCAHIYITLYVTIATIIVLLPHRRRKLFNKSIVDTAAARYVNSYLARD